MTSVEELIKKQAAYIERKSVNIEVAKRLEAEAQALRSEGAKPVSLNFREAIRKDKEARLDKFSANSRASYLKDLDAHMKAYGWLCFHYNDKTATRSYGKAEMPDYKVVVKGGTFSILNKGAVEVAGIYLKDDKLQFVNPGKFIKNVKK